MHYFKYDQDHDEKMKSNSVRKNILGSSNEKS